MTGSGIGDRRAEKSGAPLITVVRKASNIVAKLSRFVSAFSPFPRSHCSCFGVFTKCTPKFSSPNLYMGQVIRMVMSELLQMQDRRVRAVGGPRGSEG